MKTAVNSLGRIVPLEVPGAGAFEPYSSPFGQNSGGLGNALRAEAGARRRPVPRQACEIPARRDRKVRPARRHDDIVPPPPAQRRRGHSDGARRARGDGLQESDLRAELDSRRPRLRGGLYKERPHRQALHLRRARQARAAAFERRGRHSGNHPQPRRTRARDRRRLDSDRRRLPRGPGLRLASATSTACRGRRPAARSATR